MAVEEVQKRFRKRGGAKKKKKKADAASLPAFTEVTQPSPVVPPSNDTNPNYVSGFTAEFKPQSGRVGQELQSYLDKLQASLEEVDPGAEAALAYFPGDEEAPESVLLSRNALTELAPKLAQLSLENNAARFIEILLRTAKSKEVLSEALDAVLSAGASHVVDLAIHRCASHVLETLIVSLREVGSDLNALNPIVSAWTPEQFKGLISSPSGSHVFRLIVATLSGLPSDEPREAKLDDSYPKQIHTYIDKRESVSDESLSAVRDLVNTILNADIPLQDMLWESKTSAALQGLLSAVTVADKALAKKLGEECLKAGVANLVNDSCGSRFVERLILCLGCSLVEKDIKGHLAELARHPKGNFVVQRYLLGLKGRGAVMSAWDELEVTLPSMLGSGRVREGVVLALLRVTEAQGDENCRRRASRAVARACGATGAKVRSLVGILAMGSEEIWERWKQTVQELGLTGMGIYGRPNDILQIRGRIVKAALLGTLIGRCVMRFPGGPGQATRDSMMALSNVEILALIADPCGSRLVEQWIQDEKVERSMKIASKVFNIIWECGESMALLAVARSHYGAMVIVRCCPLLEGPQRKQMMDALASNLRNLKEHSSGQMVVRKCRVEHYMRKGDQWEQEKSTKQTKQRLFAEILEEDSEPEEATSPPEKKTKFMGRERTGLKRKRTNKGASLVGDLDQDDSLKESKAHDNSHSARYPMDDGVSKENGAGSVEESALAPVLNAIQAAAKPLEKKKKAKKKRRRGDDTGKS